MQKNTNVFIILIAATTLIIFYLLFQLGHKKNKVIDENNVVGQKMQKTQKQSRQRSLAGQPIDSEQDMHRKNVQNFSNKIADKLGADDLGMISLNVLFNSLLAKQRTESGQGPVFCRHQIDCKISLESLYTTVFDKFDIETHSKVKALFQSEMLESDLDPNIKIQILVGELTKSEVGQIPPTSYRDKTGRPVIGNNSVYLLATLNRLMEISDDSDLIIRSSMTAIHNLQDEVGRLLLKLTLVHRYPQRLNEFETELKKLGIHI